MHFKNHSPGFSLPEVLLALVLIAMVVTPMMFQQSMMLNGVYHMSERLDHIYAAQQFWYEAHAAMPSNALKFSLEKKLSDGTILNFVRESLNPKSSLAKQEHIVQERVTIAWQEAGQNRREQLVSYVYVIPPQKAPA
jgi:prepilin-type N-terminal cleavage/methylation domain-containing protein